MRPHFSPCNHLFFRITVFLHLFLSPRVLPFHEDLGGVLQPPPSFPMAWSFQRKSRAPSRLRPPFLFLRLLPPLRNGSGIQEPRDSSDPACFVLLPPIDRWRACLWIQGAVAHALAHWIPAFPHSNSCNESLGRFVSGNLDLGLSMRSRIPPPLELFFTSFISPLLDPFNSSSRKFPFKRTEEFHGAAVGPDLFPVPFHPVPLSLVLTERRMEIIFFPPLPLIFQYALLSPRRADLCFQPSHRFPVER